MVTEMEAIRRCKRCDETKPIGSFPKRYNRPGLREWTCCMCKKRGWITADPERAKAKKHVEGMRRRARSKGMTVDEYDALMAAKHGPKADGRIRIDGVLVKKNMRKHCPLVSSHPRTEYRLNSEKKKFQQRAYYQANPEKGRSRIKRWKYNNPGKVSKQRYRRRTLLLDAECSLTTEQWLAIRAAYNERCAYCQRRRPLTMDHVTPVSKGGGHVASNIVPACQSCNSSKNVGPPPSGLQMHLIC